MIDGTVHFNMVRITVQILPILSFLGVILLCRSSYVRLICVVYGNMMVTFVFAFRTLSKSYFGALLYVARCIALSRFFSSRVCKYDCSVILSVMRAA